MAGRDRKRSDAVKPMKSAKNRRLPAVKFGNPLNYNNFLCCQLTISPITQCHKHRAERKAPLTGHLCQPPQIRTRASDRRSFLQEAEHRNRSALGPHIALGLDQDWLLDPKHGRDLVSDTHKVSPIAQPFWEKASSFFACLQHIRQRYACVFLRRFAIVSRLYVRRLGTLRSFRV